MKDALSQSPAGKAIKVSFKSCFYQQQISSLFTIMFQVISAFWKNSLLYKKVLQQNIFNFQLHFFQIFIFIINKFQMNATFRGLFANRNLPLNISIIFLYFHYTSADPTLKRLEKNCWKNLSYGIITTTYHWQPFSILCLLEVFLYLCWYKSKVKNDLKYVFKFWFRYGLLAPNSKFFDLLQLI